MFERHRLERLEGKEYDEANVSRKSLGLSIPPTSAPARQATDVQSVVRLHITHATLALWKVKADPVALRGDAEAQQGILSTARSHQRPQLSIVLRPRRPRSGCQHVVAHVLSFVSMLSNAAWSDTQFPT